MDTTTATKGTIGVANQAADAAASLADGARSALDSGMKRAQRVATDWASQAGDTVSDVSMRGYRGAEDAIRMQPVLAVAGALLAGVLLGALLFSRED
jgi:ElaB/YqjD/DUF883 family membrane-anchored ribosome-binding protein